jgi:hypothetical protein
MLGEIYRRIRKSQGRNNVKKTSASAAASADHKETLICSKFVCPCRCGVPVHIKIGKACVQTVKDTDFGFREPSIARG